MKAFKAVSLLALTVVFTLLGETIYMSWLDSFPPFFHHPYLWRSHGEEAFLIIPLMAFGTSLVTHAAFSKSNRREYLAVGSVIFLTSIIAFAALFLIKSVGTPWEWTL